MMSSSPYFFYVHEEEREITVKLTLPSQPLTTPHIISALEQIDAAAPLRHGEWVLSLDGKTPIASDDELQRVRQNSDVFLLPKPKDAARPRSIYCHLFRSRAEDDPIATVRLSFDPSLKREAVVREVLSAPDAAAATQLFEETDSVSVEFVRSKGEPPVAWARNSLLPCYPLGGDVMIYPNDSSEAVVPSHASLAALRQQCEILEARGQFASAAELIENAVRSLSSDAEKRHLKLGLAEMWLERARVPDRAIRHIKAILPEVENHVAPDHVRLLILLGKSYFMKENFKLAAEYFSKALSESSENCVSLPADTATDLRLHIGASLFAQGRDEGIHIIQEALKGDTSNTFGVMWMSKVYAAKGHHDDAIQWAVQLLVKDQKNEELMRNFAVICSSVPDAVNIIKTKILSGVHTAEVSVDKASIWGFLAQTARDQGQLQLAADMFQEALNLMPQSAHYALNHAHVWEQWGRPIDALRAIVLFLKANPELTMNGRSGAAELLPPLEAGLRAAISGERGMHTEVIRLTAQEEVVVAEPSRESLAIEPRSSSGWDANNLSREALSPGDRLLTREELSLGALYFTAVKVLYTLGCLQVIPPIIQRVEPGRRLERMSRTLMKNEHAYYTTICETMQWLNATDARNPSSLLRSTSALSNENQLFVCGDSHSLPLSWQSVALGNNDASGDNLHHVLTVNKLVTGLKIWHMRRGCTFYPRINFEAVINSIPTGADVLFVFGEIDCREGLLRAVEKGVYRDFTEAALKLVEIYTETLRRIRRERQLRHVFVHAVLPILNITRQIVVAFNRILASALPKEFILIDNTDEILTLPSADSAQPSEIAVSAGEIRVVKPCFALDETHINPRYVTELLEPALQRALSR